LVVKAVTRGGKVSFGFGFGLSFGLVVVGFGVVGATNLSAPVDEHADPRHAIL